MGSYVADHSEIEARLVGRLGFVQFSGSTRPKDADVDDYIDHIEAEINGVLSAAGYSNVPATADSDKAMIRQYVVDAVCVFVWTETFTENDPPFMVKKWDENYRSFISKLRRGEQHLPSQNPNSEADPAFLITRAPSRDDYFTERYDTTDWDE